MGIVKIKQNKEKCNIVLSSSSSTSYETPIDANISGNQTLREDIKTKSGITQMSLLSTNDTLKKKGGGKIFAEHFSGPFTIVSSSEILEGGDSANPNKLVNISVMGINNE